MSDPIYGFNAEFHLDLPPRSQLRLDILALADAALRRQMERLEREGRMLGKAGYAPEELTILYEDNLPPRVVPTREIERR